MLVKPKRSAPILPSSLYLWGISGIWHQTQRVIDKSTVVNAAHAGAVAGSGWLCEEGATALHGGPDQSTCRQGPQPRGVHGA